MQLLVTIAKLMALDPLTWFPVVAISSMVLASLTNMLLGEDYIGFEYALAYVYGWLVVPYLVVCAVLEEVFFRWIPMIFFGSIGVVIGTILWLIMHLVNVRRAVSMIPWSIYLAALYIYGKPIYAVVAHVAWNALVGVVAVYVANY